RQSARLRPALVELQAGTDRQPPDRLRRTHPVPVPLHESAVYPAFGRLLPPLSGQSSQPPDRLRMNSGHPSPGSGVRQPASVMLPDTTLLRSVQRTRARKRWGRPNRDEGVGKMLLPHQKKQPRSLFEGCLPPVFDSPRGLFVSAHDVPLSRRPPARQRAAPGRIIRASFSSERRFAAAIIEGCVVADVEPHVSAELLPGLLGDVA
ncbi:MAG: hypothetical protein ACI8RZ_005769, partial [Myxococcota bacterium]